MEVEENSLPIVDNNDENNPKKGKLLTLLFPTESQPTEGKEAKRDKNKPPSKVSHKIGYSLNQSTVKVL